MPDYRAIEQEKLKEMRPNPWAKMIKAMDRLCLQVKLTAFHTQEAAKYADKAGIQVGLTAFYVNQFLKHRELNKRVKEN